MPDNVFHVDIRVCEVFEKYCTSETYKLHSKQIQWDLVYFDLQKSECCDQDSAWKKVLTSSPGPLALALIDLSASCSIFLVKMQFSYIFLFLRYKLKKELYFHHIWLHIIRRPSKMTLWHCCVPHWRIWCQLWLWENSTLLFTDLSIIAQRWEKWQWKWENPTQDVDFRFT